MSRQSFQHEKAGKRKAQYCDLEGQDSISCNYEQHGASIVFERVAIPSSNQHLNLVGKALCRKHKSYVSTARYGTEGKKFKKAPERLVKFFKLPHGAMMC